MKLTLQRWINLRNGIYALAGIMFLSGFLLIVSPVLPSATRTISRKADTTRGHKYNTKLAQDFERKNEVELSGLKPLPKDNTLVIPKIGIDAQIYEGTDERTLEKGVWRKPGTGTPGTIGNMVLAAHRYTGVDKPDLFYDLDKLAKGDRFEVIWLGKEYVYEVTETFDVNADQIEIENPTSNEIITLYTCTPLWTSLRRLVVRARPVPIASLPGYRK